MNILFFFVHPSKYHLFRHTINRLKEEGNRVDVCIITKDVLEDLVKSEGWDYTNIFPEGRRIKELPVLLSTGINFLRTLWRLFRYTFGKKYDLFVTDDSLTIIGKIKGVPSMMFIDDDISVVPEIAMLLSTADFIIAPKCTDLGRYTRKKIGFNGYKELAYLHPAYFTPDIKKINTFNPEHKPYVIIRLVSLTASHDRNAKGISDTILQKLISRLSEKYRVFISSERPLKPPFGEYKLKIDVKDIAHALYFAEMYIGDSQTMTSEAALLGTPAIRLNDFVGKINSMEEKEHKYGLTFGFRLDELDKMFVKVEELMNLPGLKKTWAERREKMLRECQDTNDVIYQAIISYRQRTK